MFLLKGNISALIIRPISHIEVSIMHPIFPSGLNDVNVSNILKERTTSNRTLFEF